jgi:hypothetical protein
MRTVLDPTGERRASVRARLPRPASLQGRTVGLLDISKAHGEFVLDRLEDLLTTDGSKVHRYRKPTFARTAPADLRHGIAEQCELVIEALADEG